ncbi:MAG: adenylate/guanylate cyclase domain-containing protein [Thiotrichales bacterium]|nr:adenylate/guanylate cyclase domain-containing protein [Thiotrichales bacterium]
MFSILNRHGIRIFLVFFVFFIFIGNALGILELGLAGKPQILFGSHLLSQIGNKDYSLVQLISSLDVIAFLLVGLILCVLLPLLSPINASALTFVCMLIPFAISYFLPMQNTMIPMEYSLLTILVIYVFNVMISYFIEVHQKQALLETFSQYVPPELAHDISRHPDKINMDGEARRLTVFFSDLQNFTSVSEQLNPKQLATLLNEYFTAMTEVLYRHGATIDKYIGDSIMAFWGAPFAQEDHAVRSINAAFEMHEQIKVLCDSFVKRGWPAPDMSIGINTGMMNVGNMGSKYRVAYTVVGDAVNLASRVEHLTRIYQVPTIVTESTMKAAPDFVYRELDLVQVRGKHNHTKIYQPMCHKKDLSGSLEKELEHHHIALNYFHDKNWSEAAKRFEKLKSGHADPYYSCMLDIIDSNSSN